MSNDKIIYILLDGVGDLPNPDLNYLTPLEAAFTPNIDKISRNGISGEVISVGDGIAPQSDIAVFNMLSYNFKDEDYVGRGVVECIGCGIDFKDGDLALRGNFATVDPNNKKIIDRRAGRIVPQEDSIAICKEINDKLRIADVEFSIKPTIGHRVIVRFRTQKTKLGENITNTDPAYDKVGGIGIALNTSERELYVASSKSNSSDSSFSATIVNKFSDEVINILNKSDVNIQRNQKGLLPINCILLRDAGNRYPHLESISNRFQLKFASLVDMPVEIGISKILDMQAYDAGDVNNYDLKANTLLNILEKHDVFYVHIKGPDEFGHDGNPKGKKENIEQIDKYFFGTLIKEVAKLNNININFIISGDHSTPCTKKAHTDDPIPLLISGKNIKSDGTTRFTEKCAKSGSLGRIRGHQVLNTAIKKINPTNEIN